MSICFFDVIMKDKKLQGTMCGLLFVALSVAVYMMNIQGAAVSFAMGLMACTDVVVLAAGFEKKFGSAMNCFVKYTMPIFLMHTLFAVPIRAVLLKIGVENAGVHVVMGLAISFMRPLAAAWIMKKTKWLEFFLDPNKFVRKVS